MHKLHKLLKENFNNIKKNVLMVALVMTNVLGDLILRSLTVGSVFKIRPLISSITILLFLSVITVLLSNKKRDYMYVVFSILFSVFNTAHYMYYKHFNSFLSIGVLNQTKNLIGLNGSIIQTMDIKVLLFTIPSIIFIAIYYKLRENADLNIDYSDISLKEKTLSPFILGVSLLLMIATTLSSTDVSRLVKQWNREYLVEQFGIYTFAVADAIKLTTLPTSIKADYGDFNKLLNSLVKDNESKNVDNEYTNYLAGKDLFVIHYESIQSFVMDLEFSDGEVTPFLNKLSQEGLFFNNFYPQHSVGTSSDSEFTFSTSLYPINNNTVFINHTDKQFVTLQNLLTKQGYHTMSMHGNNRSFWNRDFMHPNLGYEEVLGKEDYVIDEEVGLGLSDMSFYKQSVNILKNRKETINKPLMATLISLSNHYPFDDLEVYGDYDTGYLEGSELSNYLKSVNYADKALEKFFTQMDSEGLLDNAAVVIYGDHHAKISKEDYELLYNYEKSTNNKLDQFDSSYINIDNAYMTQVRKTPLLIWTKDKRLSKVVDKPMGMIDVMPTLSNMFGVNNPYQFGEDILSVDKNTVVFPDGSFLNSDYFYSAADVKVYDMATNELILDEVDFDKKLLNEISSIEKRLDFSESIIEYDLIRYHESSLK